MSAKSAHRNPRQYTLLATTLVALLSATGCGDEQLGSVNGQVTYEGVPISEGMVYFVPQQGPQAQARLDEEGRYVLATPGKGQGAMIGQHRVCFVPPVSEEEEQAKQNLSLDEYLAGQLPEAEGGPIKTVIPHRMMSIHTSRLVREVKAGDNEFNIDLAQVQP